LRTELGSERAQHASTQQLSHSLVELLLRDKRASDIPLSAGDRHADTAGCSISEMAILSTAMNEMRTMHERLQTNIRVFEARLARVEQASLLNAHEHVSTPVSLERDVAAGAQDEGLKGLVDQGINQGPMTGSTAHSSGLSPADALAQPSQSVAASLRLSSHPALSACSSICLPGFEHLMDCEDGAAVDLQRSEPSVDNHMRSDTVDDNSTLISELPGFAKHSAASLGSPGPALARSGQDLGTIKSSVSRGSEDVTSGTDGQMQHLGPRPDSAPMQCGQKGSFQWNPAARMFYPVQSYADAFRSVLITDVPGYGKLSDMLERVRTGMIISASFCDTTPITGKVSVLITFAREESARAFANDANRDPSFWRNFPDEPVPSMRVEMLSSPTHPMAGALERQIQNGATRILQARGLPPNLTAEALVSFLSEPGTKHHGLVSARRTDDGDVRVEFSSVALALRAVERARYHCVLRQACWKHCPDPCGPRPRTDILGDQRMHDVPPQGNMATWIER